MHYKYSVFVEILEFKLRNISYGYQPVGFLFFTLSNIFCLIIEIQILKLQQEGVFTLIYNSQTKVENILLRYGSELPSRCRPEGIMRKCRTPSKVLSVP